TGEYLESDRQTSSRYRPSELLVWSGESQAEIQAQLATLSAALAGNARPELCDLAYSRWHAARNRPGLTLAMVVSSLDDLRERVQWTANALNGTGLPSALYERT